MQHVILSIHMILAVALIIVVLLQRSEGAGLAGPSSSGMMPVRGSANILTRTTAILAGGFMLTSLVLAILANQQRPALSLADTIAAEQQQQQGSVPLSDAPPLQIPSEQAPPPDPAPGPTPAPTPGPAPAPTSQPATPTPSAP